MPHRPNDLGRPALPNNLPGQLSSFIGRGRELAEVRALVGSSRLVTLTGAGGCGKTRLGLQVAAELLDGSGDGVWLAELAAVTDQAAVAPAIAAALEIAGQPGRPALETLVDALAPQEILIVLDNCEHLIGDCAKIAELILRRCPRVHLLATSREPIGICGETVYRVPSLSLPESGDLCPAAESSDAIALFVDRARTQGVSLADGEQTAQLVVSVCRRLDGMPLAIELAAARLRTMSLASLHDRLDQRFRLLTGGSRTALLRQQTLRATVEWSYSLLNPAEQLLLRRLSVFAESFDLEAAEAVCGFGDLEALDVACLVGALADKSLVGAEPDGGFSGYRLLETIRQFAAERLAEARDDEAADTAAAHCAHFLGVAEAAAPHLTGPEQGRWLAGLDAQQANLRRAAEHAARRPGGTALILRFAVALRRYWMARCRGEETRGLLVPALQRPDARADPRLFGAALATAVLTARAAGAGTVRQLGEQAVEFARQLGDERLLIESLAAGCEGYFYAGEPERGRPIGQEAVERARQLGDDVLLGESLMECLLCSDHIGPADYRQLFAEATACTGRSGDQLMSRYLYNNASVQALQEGDLPAARAHLDTAAQAMQAIGEDSPELPVNLGWVLRQEGDPDAARSMFGTSLLAARRNGDQAGLGYASLGLACLAADRGDGHQAGQLHGVAQAFLDRTGEPWQDPEARYRQESLDEVRARLGDDRADRAYAEGLALGIEEALDLARSQLTAPGPVQPPALAPLSARERELVILVARGATDTQIAERLYISVSTVRSHLDRIRDKTGCRRRADLTRLALQAGLV
jgi:predicted ATPase/DNA-binding CsgD family transcriptional regulator